MVLTGDGELGFDSGEEPERWLPLPSEGSRRANYPILTQGGSDNNKMQVPNRSCNWNENNLNPLSINN